ncbi:MAG: Uma2 family endonuclease [Prochlorothrix sp.]
MATVTIAPMELEAFFDYTAEKNSLYELEDGEPIEMPLESELNRRIATFLLVYFAQLGVAPHCLSLKTEVVVSGAGPTVQVPDLLVLSEVLAEVLAGATRSTVLPEMPPPRLVVEVVSPGKKNRDRDYRYKRSQYGARGIGEYWIVDPVEGCITVLIWVEGLYEEEVYGEDAVIQSPFLQALGATAGLPVRQVLTAGILP